jgi:putative transposase
MSNSRYLTELQRLEVQVSHAENCLMNGHAEQRNGLIKHHLLPTIRTSRPDGLAREIKRILDIYNHQRKQEALGWLSPCEFEEKNLPSSCQTQTYTA